jgi:hypothetical protein
VLVLRCGRGKYLLLLLEYRRIYMFSATVAVIQENPQISAATVRIRGRSNYFLLLLEYGIKYKTPKHLLL